MPPKSRKRKRDNPAPPPTEPEPDPEPASEPPADAQPAGEPLKEDASKPPDGEGEVKTEEQAEEEERNRQLWDEVAESHFSIVTELPLELRRSFDLLRDMEDLQQACLDQVYANWLAYLELRDPAPSRPPSPIPPLPDPKPPIADAEPTTDSEPAPQADTADSEAVAPTDTGEGPSQLPAELALSSRPSPMPNGHPTHSASPAPPPVPPPHPKTARQLLRDLAVATMEAVRHGDEKVNIAQGVYDTIDRHIRSLDAAIAAQHAELSIGVRSGTLPSTSAALAGGAGGKAHPSSDGLQQPPVPPPDGADGGEMMLGLAGAEGAEDQASGRQRTRRRGKAQQKKVENGVILPATPAGETKAEELPPQAAALAMPQVVLPGQLPPLPWLDMPVGEHEPRYCYCQQVSYGEMIGCDGPDCQGEWFHLGCTGLDKAPEGDWYCRDCEAKLKATEKPKRNKSGRQRSRGTRRKRVR